SVTVCRSGPDAWAKQRELSLGVALHRELLPAQVKPQAGVLGRPNAKRRTRPAELDPMLHGKRMLTEPGPPRFPNQVAVFRQARGFVRNGALFDPFLTIAQWDPRRSSRPACCPAFSARFLLPISSAAATAARRCYAEVVPSGWHLSPPLQSVSNSRR